MFGFFLVKSGFGRAHHTVRFTMNEFPPPKNKRKRPIVFVSGCYDLLHSGHVEFFQRAAELGDLYVSVGNDANILKLKHHETMFSEAERLFMVSAIRHVSYARVCSGYGDTDFLEDLKQIQPEFFFVNEDGDNPTKRAAVENVPGVRFVVAKRTPAAGLVARSSTALKASLSKQ